MAKKEKVTPKFEIQFLSDDDADMTEIRLLIDGKDTCLGVGNTYDTDVSAESILPVVCKLLGGKMTFKKYKYED